MEESDRFYSLSIEDIQRVASEVCDRKLTPDEIGKIIPKIEERMPWFDVIENAIEEVIVN